MRCLANVLVESFCGDFMGFYGIWIGCVWTLMGAYGIQRISQDFDGIVW